MELTGRLLLDTHALLWTLLEPGRIPAETLVRIRAADTELLVSAAGAWEIGTKFRLGKLDEARSVVHGYPDHLSRLRARQLPISAHHASTAGMFAWDHADPFDRVIIAQCMIESVPLVTADRALTAFPGVQTVWQASTPSGAAPAPETTVKPRQILRRARSARSWPPGPQ